MSHNLSVSAVIAKLQRCKTRNYDPVNAKHQCRTSLRTSAEHEAAIVRHTKRVQQYLKLHPEEK